MNEKKSKEIVRIRKKLECYTLLKKERAARIKDYNDYIEEAYNTLKASIIDGSPKSEGSISDQTGNKAVEITEILQNKKTEIECLEKEIYLIEAAINNLEYEERHILFLRYIRGIPWTNLPEYTGYQNTQNHKYVFSGIKNIAKQKLL